MTKLTVTCREFRPLRRGTLVGFATIEIPEMQLVIGDVAIDQKALSRWALLPAKPQIKDGELVKDPVSGKVQYTHLMDFTSRAVCDAFSAAVVRAVLERAPDAFAMEADA
jgi:hypothetical protein